ncbi:hypothetical protein A9K75_08835 [Campylobacter fetus subsp. testudinum]|uniref:hypothetical protein n=1 Tax=Campylobacter fetus TaxID=196 RepID=UPI0008188952|nr:hypothetical protein [Campylobacter fetus]OCR99004.1 hypothetical protein A9K75_08835 [Campylobacter fetus subsp. testudinum]
MIKINIANNDINELRQLFINNEVGEFLYIEDDKVGYVENASSCGEIFYFVKGVLEGKKIILENGEFIDL